MNLTQKAHRALLEKKGLDEAEIADIVKAKCDRGEYMPDDEDGDEDEAMAKALSQFEADLKKAEDMPERVRDFSIKMPDTGATDPQDRPPGERTPVPEDIDNINPVGILTDIVKAMVIAASEDTVSNVIKALTPVFAKIEGTLAKAAARDEATQKLLKAQVAGLADVRKSFGNKVSSLEKALNSQPADKQPRLDSKGYTVLPTPGEAANQQVVKGAIDPRAFSEWAAQEQDTLFAKGSTTSVASLTVPEKTRAEYLQLAVACGYGDGGGAYRAYDNKYFALSDIAKALDYKPATAA